MKNNKKKHCVIIVGGGTAGSIICSRLESEFNLTVFEKSDKRRIPLFNKIPLLIGLLYSSNNKYIKKIDLEFNSRRSLPFFQSNVLGGASAMNGCVHVLGIYPKWTSFLKKFNLEIKNMEDAFENLFSRKFDRNKISLRLARQHNIDHAFQSAFKKINIEIGRTDLMNEQACGPIVNTTRKFFRSSVLNLKPYRKSKLLLNEKVTNLLLNDDDEVIGVVADGKEYHADHVILSAGVIGTNELLMRPAIRASDQKEVDLNLDVGKGIKDHVNLRINVSSNKKIESLNIISKSLMRKVLIFVKHLFGINTLMIGTGATSSANIDLDDDGIVDTRINLLNFSEQGRLGSDGEFFEDARHGFSLSISSINPLSEGHIEFSASDGIRLKPNYLEHPEDEKNLNKAIDLCLLLLRSDPLSDYVLEIKDKEKIDNQRKSFIEDGVYSGYHLIGGCQNILNENFQVKKFNSLNICDASIFDEYLSSNIHAPVAVVADLFSEKFINRAG